MRSPFRCFVSIVLAAGLLAVVVVGAWSAPGQTSKTSTERDRSARLVVSDFRETPEEVRVDNRQDHMIVEFRNGLNQTVEVDVLKPDAKKLKVNPEGKMREYLPTGTYTMKFVTNGLQPAQRVDIRLERAHVYICEITRVN